MSDLSQHDDGREATDVSGFAALQERQTLRRHTGGVIDEDGRIDEDAAGARNPSSVKLAVLFFCKPRNSPPVEFQDAPAVGDDTGSCPATDPFRQVPFERLAQNRTDVLALPDGLQLGTANQVVIQDRTDLSPHVMTVS